MEWTCPVCGRQNADSWICPDCGFDHSRDYERYPTLTSALPAGAGPAVPLADQQRQEQERQEQERRQEEARLREREAALARREKELRQVEARLREQQRRQEEQERQAALARQEQARQEDVRWWMTQEALGLTDAALALLRKEYPTWAEFDRAAARQAQEQQAAEEAERQEEARQREQAQQAEQDRRQAEQAKQAKKRRRNRVLIAAAVLLAVLAAGGVFLLGGGAADGADSAEDGGSAASEPAGEESAGADDSAASSGAAEAEHEYQYEYDADGNVTAAYYYEDGVLVKTWYEYDEDGNVRHLYTNRGGDLTYSAIYNNGTLTEEVVYENDADGQIIKITDQHYTNDGTRTAVYVYEYNEDSHPVSGTKTVTDPDGATIVTCYANTYESGVLVSHRESNEGETWWEETYYDESGCPIRWDGSDLGSSWTSSGTGFEITYNADGTIDLQIAEGYELVLADDVGSMYFDLTPIDIVEAGTGG